VKDALVFIPTVCKGSSHKCGSNKSSNREHFLFAVVTKEERKEKKGYRKGIDRDNRLVHEK
jgi:hypothetical protein